MEIQLYLQPLNPTLIEAENYSGRRNLLNIIDKHTESHFPDTDKPGLAIVGVEEDRGNPGNSSSAAAPDAIRKAFYTLFCHWPELRIIDLGNIKAGHTIEDTYFALSQVVGHLIRNKMTVIILGGTQDLTFANYQAYENTGQLVNIASVDPAFDLGQDGEDLNAHSYLSRIIIHQPNYLFNFTNLGYQSYYVDADAVSLMKNMFFDVYRLGLVKAQPEETEPVVRNADILSFDISSIRASDAPGNGQPLPNGFSGEEACRICRYAGMSDKLSSIGIYEFNPAYDRQGITASLIAQMIWYFIDGFAHRLGDLPIEGSNEFARYNVRIEGHEEEVVFLRSKKTDRWWIDLSFGRKDRKKYERHHYVPCSKNDYESALKDDIPDRWWQFYQKLM
ncbi:MAG: formimidoylglutamase [Bacteroidales bacterium]|nr:formimidoylglutamase [Bacteroidales bacterium]